MSERMQRAGYAVADTAVFGAATVGTAVSVAVGVEGLQQVDSAVSALTAAHVDACEIHPEVSAAVQGVVDTYTSEGGKAAEAIQGEVANSPNGACAVLDGAPVSHGVEHGLIRDSRAAVMDTLPDVDPVSADGLRSLAEGVAQGNFLPAVGFLGVIASVAFGVWYVSGPMQNIRRVRFMIDYNRQKWYQKRYGS